MDQNFTISSSTSSSSKAPKPQEFQFPSTLLSNLQFLLQTQPFWWNYAILWQTTTHNINNNTETLSLIWAEGHFQGFRSPSTKPTKQPIISDEEGSSMDDMVTDVELFYMSSPTRSHPIKQGGVLAKVYTTGSLVWLSGAGSLGSYNCDRVKEAGSHGLETLVIIPVSNGVLELGSIDSIHENWDLVQQVNKLFGLLSVPDKGYTRPNFVTNNDLHSHLSLSERCDSDRLLSPEKTARRRGRRRSGTLPITVNHVEAERQRRDKMNIRFYALRSVVPYVSKMDKASLLSDAVAYINELKSKIESLELQLKFTKECASNNSDNCTSTLLKDVKMINVPSENHRKEMTAVIPTEVNVRILGSEAMIRVQCENINHPTARLMDLFKELNLQVKHATISTIGELMIQDVVISNVSMEIWSSDELKNVIFGRLTMIDEEGGLKVRLCN
ncbi:transcription factor bHLH14-like [Silene latifolia]|uniref:transcription factor bHLH14-like n=1 Tax=Silene latifolia TaxID=37657 RepID=UPI003D77A1F3